MGESPKYSSTTSPYQTAGQGYKPIPPPKTSVYKPVPPPKPKACPPRSHPQMGTGNPPQTTEGNYMNSNGYSNGYASSASLHYHSSPMVTSTAAANGGHYSMYGNRSNFQAAARGEENDSGQGSSLDRDYAVYNNHASSAAATYSTSSKPVTSPYNTGNVAAAAAAAAASNHSRGQYYYNVPHQNGSNGGVSNTPQRRPDGLDLSNREYRGSAFELYKKPNHYSFANGHHQQVGR